jgi:hypothetical protein
MLVNGSPRRLRLEPRVKLLDALREYAGLTGTRKGGDHGQCGACAVLIDGRRINSWCDRHQADVGSVLRSGTPTQGFEGNGWRWSGFESRVSDRARLTPARRALPLAGKTDGGSLLAVMS